MRRGLLAVWLVAVAVACVPACAQRHCVPDYLGKSRDLIDLSAPPDAHAPVAPGATRAMEEDVRRRAAAAHPPGARPYQFLALSGGGMYGAFGVGILTGWTESGTRPQFDVVTGISSGALMSTFAFLGPQYDAVLQSEMIGIDRRDILRLRPLSALTAGQALFSSRRFEQRIERHITPELLAEVAQAHAAGRRLYIGTTSLDTRRLIIWDMGQIASRGTPEAAALYRDVVLASCSVPGVIPPVRIPVEIDGHRYDELHVDGGVSDTVIFRAFMVADLNRAAGVPDALAPPGSTLYVVNNGKLYAEAECVRPRIIPMLSASSSSILYGKTRDELYRIYMNCLETAVDFRAAAVPQELPLSSESAFQLTAADQTRLFEAGHQIGHRVEVGEHWRDLPPGSDPTEQALPRAGTRFATPGSGFGAGAGGCEPVVRSQ